MISLNTLPNPRQINALVAAGCAGLMAVALYMEKVMGLEPCHLCMMQRLMVITAGVIAAVGAIHGPGAAGVRIYGGLTLLSIMTGAGLSMRQLWLQSLPADQVPACGASLDYMMEVFPITEVIAMVLAGDGTCAEVLWTFLGISIPGWTLVAFVGIGVIALLQIFQPTRGVVPAGP